MVVGGIVQTATYGAPQLIVGRIISGIGNGKSDTWAICHLTCSCFLGMNTSTIPVYVSETAHNNRRGRAVAIQLSVVIVSGKAP